jgi:hypothetical protein
MAIDKKVRLVCYEDQFEALLADLALHKLDVVLTDREVPSGSALRVFSHCCSRARWWWSVRRRWRRNTATVFRGA